MNLTSSCSKQAYSKSSGEKQLCNPENSSPYLTISQLLWRRAALTLSKLGWALCAA